ncbi:hypothetical protein BAUCODRAFT_63045 [Baudoinia panamericana UAMH 10762]|uniref:Arf-GAP domain-containing protein n=1 Tax=Baudoinia panamericana (strain UAMH 10762) TaxID=717646 RepID=M2LYC7_BAUPA|nr:uncharacterized protein BAUCODRAFT_63045 [Baudoinia panamericana UAMH 10762]EMC99712.1 hypothetical protein BAUCODRAFT_63045 [Baudoinia panamericana UAMH 10762]
MSRRAPVGADAAERNRSALKTLAKLEPNKLCADCKRNKHPRWASWNLGIFICIRCSGIHRSLGVHISRVKSVDLDSWTDEQLASMVKWGNKRANRYWEHKLAEGHMPSESKMESFIRTKYDSKRWAMDGPMPDPSTLDEAGDVQAKDDDDVPLSVVQERARSGSGRNGTLQPPQQPRVRPQDVDLFGDPGSAPPARPSTTEPAVSRPAPPKAQAAPPRQTKPGESLLGLDFFGGTQSAPPQRPSSTGPNTTGMPGRTDLKQSILSLYASKPSQPQQPSSNMNAFGGMQSPPLASPSHQQSSTQALGGLGDAFGSLTFTSPPAQSAKPSPFAGLSSPAGHSRQPSIPKTNPLSGGSFFDAKPAPPPKQATSPPTQQNASFGGDFGDFSAAVSSPAPQNTTANKSLAPASGLGDLFDLASPTMPAPAPPPKPSATSTPLTAKPPAPIQASSYTNSTAFNLSSPTQPPAPKPAPAAQTSSMSSFTNMNNMDAWGSNDAWATPDPAPAPAPAPAPTQTLTSMPPPQTQSTNLNAFKPAPAQTVQQDEEFGGWSHASPVASTTGPKQGGLGGNADDLFGNVWG